MKNLDKKQAVLCRHKPSSRQRIRQQHLTRYIIGFLFILVSITIHAQIPQELIDKARAAGMTEEQIQKEIAKHGKEQNGINQIIHPTAENIVSDRSQPTQQALPPRSNATNISLSNLWKILFSGEKSFLIRI